MDTRVVGSIDRRRRARLRGVDWRGILRVRVRPGHDATLIDWSHDGAAIETSCRLLPGSAVELQIDSDHGRTCVRGRVVRCAVVRLEPNRVTYRGAIQFEGPLSQQEA